MKEMAARTRKAGEQIAGFLADVNAVGEWSARKVGILAAEAGCPIRPPAEADYLDIPVDERSRYVPTEAQVGGEPHCQRVTVALQAAIKLGLAARFKRLNADGQRNGPWYYYATTPKETTP